MAAVVDGSLDTNVLLRLALREIPEQYERAKRLIERPGARFRVSDTAIIEFAYALSAHYGFSRVQVADAISSMGALASIICERAFFNAVVEQYVAHPKLSFEDCYLAEKAKVDDALPLWTFDRKLARQSEHTQEVPV
ncbi:MAG: PIN domain-containing protein [Coriobacteriales bacterium]|jgi:predicted nucleic-acid-binding protein|nr:PIN domain-containing protein [Coriobacteriales bacterium]